MRKEKDTFVILTDNDEVLIKPITPYHIMKYEKLEGDRIFYEFDSGVSIQETFDDGIFNCQVHDKSMQMRDKDALVEAINEHEETGSYDKFLEMFNEQYERTEYVGIIKYLLSEHRKRLEFKELPLRVVVDELFMVDAHGQAYLKKGKEWEKLCLVAKNKDEMKAIKINTPAGIKIVDAQAQEIAAKVMFLLKPDVDDEVYVKQIVRAEDKSLDNYLDQQKRQHQEHVDNYI